MFFRRLFPYRTLWSWYKSFPLSALSVHRKSIVHFEKTIILGHLSWVKTIVYYFNSLKYFIEVSLSADQPAACLPDCRIPKPQYTTLSPPLPIFPAEPANPMCCLCCLLSWSVQISFPTFKDYSSCHLRRKNLPLPCVLCSLFWTSAHMAWERGRLRMYFTGSWEKKRPR